MKTLASILLRASMYLTKRMSVREAADCCRQNFSRSEKANLFDLYFAYKLILNREPDVEGFAFWKTEILRGMPVAQLIGSFVQSSEFQSRVNQQLSLVKTVEEFYIFVNPDDVAVGQIISANGLWEGHLTNFIKRNIQSGDTVLDIGANYGWFSLLAAKIVGPHGKVCAVEINPSNLKALFNSARKNNFGNITVFPFGASDSREIISYTSLGSNGGFSDALHENQINEFAQTYRLDDLLCDFSNIRLVKIDVEGHEPHVIDGLRKTLLRDHPMVVFEFHGAKKSISGRPSSESIELLKKLNYSFGIVDSDGTLEAIEPNNILPYWEKVNQLGNSQGLQHLDLVAYQP